MKHNSIRARVVAACFLALSTQAFAEQHTAGVPALSSRPGAAYTIYVDVSGFNYVGDWWATNPDGGAKQPGFTPSLNDVAPTGTFGAAEQTQIKTLWATLAQTYIGLNVNVTTVDPAPLALQSSDTARRNFYDATPNLMHTVIGSGSRPELISPTNTDGNWFPGADGVSPGIGVVAGTVAGPNSSTGQHTNWMFSQAQAGAGNGGVINGLYIGGISAHENGHSFGLYHQGDYTAAAQNAEYTLGDGNAGNGSYIAIMGDANARQRIAWRKGTANNGAFVQQNDLKLMLSTNTAAMATSQGRSGGADLHFVEDGKGHSLLAATPLALTGTAVDFTQNKGVIVPLSESDPNPTGAANYTQDWYKFTTLTASNVDFVAHDSTDFLTPGIADSEGTLRSTMAIFNSAGIQIGTAAEDISTMFETYDGLLAAGTYYLGLSSFGGHDQVNNPAFDPATYFDTGAYFLTGSIVAVPEPTVIGFIAFGVIGLLGRRHRQKFSQ